MCIRDRIWAVLIQGLPELSTYPSFIAALEDTAKRLGVAWPNKSDLNNRSHDGYFNYLISDTFRTVQIWPKESQHEYMIELFTYEQSDKGQCYIGLTPSLDEVTKAVSYWFVERWTITAIHSVCPSIPVSYTHLDVYKRQAYKE